MVSNPILNKYLNDLNGEHPYWSDKYDAVKNGVHPMSSKTQCPQGHPYDLENAVISKQGWRRCLICKREGYKK